VCLLLTALLGGCAATEASSSKTVQADGSDVLCTREARTGTLFSSTRCRNAEQREQERRSVEEAADAVRRPPPRRDNGGE